VSAQGNNVALALAWPSQERLSTSARNHSPGPGWAWPAGRYDRWVTAQPPDDLDFISFVDHAVRRVADEVPGVDAQALHTILLLHRATDVIVYDLESGVHRPAGWSFAGFRMMFVLWLVGPMPSGRLARLTGSSRAAVSALAKTLEAEGLVARGTAAANRRTVVLSLTDEGRRRLLAAFEDHHKRESSWAGRLSDGEQQTLIRLLGKLIAGAGDPQVRSRE
jgi:DNA-binding MarR family transcriptional regulator